MGRKSDNSAVGAGGWAKLHQWISAYLHEKTTPRKIVEWHGWAWRKFEGGMNPADIEQRLRYLWGVESRTKSTDQMEPELLTAVHDVYTCADKGWTPAQCAVVYRSLARAYPTRYWLSEKAAAWEKAGDDWRKVAMS
jgi:hypothetical protein